MIITSARLNGVVDPSSEVGSLYFPACRSFYHPRGARPTTGFSSVRRARLGEQEKTMNSKLFIAVTASGLLISAAAYADSERYPTGVAHTFSSGMTLHDVGSEATPLFDGTRNATQSNFMIKDVGSSGYQDWGGQLVGSPLRPVIMARP
jgi:hypothetical protein